MDINETLIKMITNSDRNGAKRIIEEWGSEHGYENLLVEVLGPTLRRVGEMWRGDEFSLAHAYIASKIVEDALEKYEQEKGDVLAGVTGKGPVVLGNIEDDCHPLGRKIVVSFLKANSWDVHDLGIDVEAKTFVDEAVRVGAKVIGVSAMIFTTAENIREVRAEIDNKGMKGRIQLAVGGAVFRLRPELVEQVGGDGTAKDAIEAPALFTRLWDLAVLNEEGSNE